MLKLTDRFRIGQATATKDTALFLAWGRGDDAWGAAHSLDDRTFTGGTTLSTGYADISGVVVRSLDNVTTYEEGVDFTYVSETGVITRLTGGSIGSSAHVNVDLIEGTPEPEEEATDLVDEIGRRVVGVKQYVVRDNEGDIIVGEGRFSISVEPTAILHIRVTFDESDESDEVIKEIGLFSGTEVDPELPEGQLYFPVGDVTESGNLLATDRFPAIVRTAAAKQIFDLIINF